MDVWKRCYIRRAAAMSLGAERGWGRKGVAGFTHSPLISSTHLALPSSDSRSRSSLLKITSASPFQQPSHSAIQPPCHSAWTPVVEPKPEDDSSMAVSIKSTTACSARTMQSAGVVALLVVVAYASEISSSSSSASSSSSGATPPDHPRHTLLALVRAASGSSPPSSNPSNNNNSHNRWWPQETYSLAHGPSYEISPARSQNALPESPEQSRVQEGHPWPKRSQSSSLDPGEGQGEEEVLDGLQQVEVSLATNFLRHARSSARPYDVPQIECPPAEDQMERFPCPSPDRMGRYRCIDDHVLCDGFIDCPDGEDEDRQQCMFYKTTKAHLDVIADAIIRFIRGRK